MTDGLVLVDKPPDWTSHDVVARLRQLAGTRKVGHAGTLDPMATGVLIVGINRATRLLGHLALHDKEYDATIRLGAATTTDDAEGEVLIEADGDALADIADADIAAAMARLTGVIEQVPSAVSAIKVDGVRAYKRVRDGEAVELAARPVTISAFDLLERRGLDLLVRVECSTGTYVRALARDLGADLGVGGHLTALRRTRVGTFGLDRAHSLEELEANLAVIPVAEAAAATFPTVTITSEEATRVGHGQRLVLDIGETTTALLDPAGNLIAVVERRNGVAQPLAVFAAQADLSP
jgi:tRNA pseudouridine55 synthase